MQRYSQAIIFNPMIYSFAVFVLLLVFSCDTQRKTTRDTSANNEMALIVSRDSLTSTDSVYARLALEAVDRQCGSCHHGNRSTNTGALAVFNLQEACWYCKLTHEQAESLKGRVSGSSFSEEERNAIVSLLNEIAGDSHN
jgi:hypothetical protein